MNNLIKNITIVGGGSAGWLTAGILASEFSSRGDSAVKITLIESPDIPTVGVGEGTWPSMRQTLKKIGVSETDFLVQCDATFKQASKFNNWINGANDSYFHPFTVPSGFFETNIAEFWQQHSAQVSFADATTAQSHLCQHGLAPKQITTPEYAFACNYGYHLDAGKFSAFLQKHCCNSLGVKHILDNVLTINNAENGDIASVSTRQNGNITGDLFIDCTGTKSLLLGKHYGIDFISQKQVLFNDSALAVHVAYPSEDSPIASHTMSTAQTSGWIWDIGLPSRRGVGHVYSSAHISDDQAEQQLRDYIATSLGNKNNLADIRKIAINPGFHSKFWHKNCVAIGLSAGFIEPLEASALALIELSATMVAEQLPANRQVMDITAKRFNDKFSHRWQRIIEFLKLHYVLSSRPEPYWQDNRCSSSIPENLTELLAIWKYQTPSSYDSNYTDELFPAASFQYILYGMGFQTELPLGKKRHNKLPIANKLFDENFVKTQQLVNAMSSNRDLLNKIKLYGLSKV
jgi:hypothetical protein